MKEIRLFSRYWINASGTRIYDAMKRDYARVRPPTPTCKYPYATLLRDDGKRCNWAIHRFVALAYIGLPPADDLVVCHKDDKKTNNRYTNLYYGTDQQNVQDAIRNGCFQPYRSQAESLTEESVRRIYPDILFANEPVASIARRHGSGYLSILYLVTKGTWTHLTNAIDADLQADGQRGSLKPWRNQGESVRKGKIAAGHIGETHYNAKFSAAEVGRLYADSLLSGQSDIQIAQLHGTKDGTVYGLRMKKSWAHLTDKIDQEIEEAGISSERAKPIWEVTAKPSPLNHLTEEQVCHVYGDLLFSRMAMPAIVKLRGIAINTVSQIRDKKIWGWLTDRIDVDLAQHGQNGKFQKNRNQSATVRAGRLAAGYIGEGHYNAKLTNSQVEAIYKEAKAGGGLTEIANRHGTNLYRVYAIREKKSWSWLIDKIDQELSPVS